MAQTVTEKILSRVMGRPVEAGEIIYPEPDLVTVHDWYVVNFDKALKELGVERLYDATKVLVCTDHEPVAVSAAAAERQRRVREIVAEYDIEQFYDAGRGGHGHIFPMELGLIRPGMFVFAYDIHVTNYGAIGCLGVPLVTEISEVLACGSAWIRVPETVRVEISGQLAAGICVRDVAQRMIADLGADLVDYTTVEFGGDALADIDFGGRMTLCNTPIEIGAKSAIVETDAETEAWLDGRLDGPIEHVASDPDASFKKTVTYDLGILEPQVAAPPTPDNVVGVSEVAGRRIDYAFIGSCANGSLSDLRDAARVLNGRRIEPHVRFIVTPGTQEIASKAAAEGLLQTFIDAGAIVSAPGCGPCAGGRIGPMAPGEASINTGTRNDFGRLGASEAEIYLGSPMTVAASAVTGRITDPRELM
ncbi:MAG: aconitase/3-isopropylmalate dehydratase large subunit family protein [Alphaproteobacteria bacterium]|nr:aconitase/3-isopropylmalate dehydratase large subunit family protein [Alphaproteobacteria bacterium]